MQTCFPERKAFTLVELIVSTGIIALIMLVLVSMTNQTSKTWRATAEKVEKFQEARDGFESMTRRLAQATMNTNWDYLDVNGNPRPTQVGTTGFNSFVPMMYGRTSNLRFLSGPMSTDAVAQPIIYGTSSSNTYPTHGMFFQAPLGMASTQTYDIMNNLLNTWGYFIQAGWDPAVPGFVQTMQQPYANSTQGVGLVHKRWRSRLMEFRQPTEQMSLYDPSSDDTPSATNPAPLVPRWFSMSLNSSKPPTRSLAENIVALVIRPKLSVNDENFYKSQSLPWQLCPYYIYDSTKTANPGVTAGTNTGQVNPKNQLPPLVNVTMVALDERSAKRLDERYGTGVTGQGTGQADMGLGLASSNAQGAPNFSTLFTNQSPGGTQLEGPLGPVQSLQSTDQSDLNYLEQILIHAMDNTQTHTAEEPLTYRIFTTNVTIRGAKWSRFQTK